MTGFNFNKFVTDKGKQAEVLIDTVQDDDVDTDEEVLRSGAQTCYRDLLIVKDWLAHDQMKVRKSLKTWKIWAPQF